MVGPAFFANEETLTASHSSRNGAVVEYRQEEIPQGSYHAQLEREAQEDGIPEDDDEETSPQVSDSDVRFWSDYSRVFLHPRSSQRLPEPPGWESTEGNWLWSKEAFERYNAVRETTKYGLSASLSHSRTPTSWKGPSDSSSRSAIIYRWVPSTIRVFAAFARPSASVLAGYSSHERHVYFWRLYELVPDRLPGRVP